MKVLTLTDWEVSGGWNWLWSALAAYSDQVEHLYIQSQPDRYARWGKLIAYYPAFWALAYRALRKTRREHFDVALAFEGKNAIPYGFLRRLSGQTHPKLVSMYFSVKGVILNFLPFARYAVQGVDHLILPTQAEVEHHHRLLGYPCEQMTRLDLGAYDAFLFYKRLIHSAQGEHIFAGGRSERDYPTFIEAVRGLDVKVVINARKFNLAGIDLPGNVRLNDIMPLGQYAETIGKSKFVVVPTQNVPHAAGLTQIIYAMSSGKAVVATHTAGNAEYVQDGETGLLVEPGNPTELRRAIQTLLDHPELADQMGEAGRRRYEQRHTFERMAENIRAVLLKVSQSNHQNETIFPPPASGGG